MNATAGRVIGEGVGPDDKWILRSRKVLAAGLLVAEAAGVGPSQLPALEGFGQALVGLVAAGLVLWSTLRPDGARLHATPRDRFGAPLLLLALMFYLGCAGMTPAERFYVVDEAVLASLETAADTLEEFRPELTPQQRGAIWGTTSGLRTIRGEARSWVDNCSEDGCEGSELVVSWTRSLGELTKTILLIVEEARSDGE